MSHDAIRLNGPQLHRAILASGGLWTCGEIAKATQRTRQTVWGTTRKDARFPAPVVRSGSYVFYAGEDILDYFEVSGRYDAAQRFSEAISRLRIEQKYTRQT